MIREIIVFALLTEVVCVGASAQPIVYYCEGPWTENGIVTIRGEQLGEKPCAPPVLWDTIVNQPAYAGLTQGQTIPTGNECPWVANGGYSYTGSTKYWTLDPRIVGRAQYHAQDKGYLKGRDLGTTHPRHLYVSWWVRFSGDINQGSGGSSSTKLIRVWVSASGTTGRTSWTGRQLTYSRVAPDTTLTTSGAPWAHWQGVTNEWNKCEMLLNSEGALTSEGYLVCKTNNTEIFHPTDLGGLSSFNLVDLIGFDPSVPSNLDSVAVDFTDIYVDTTFARVILGDAPTYNDVRHTEAQIPEAWSEDGITIRVNQGSFLSGQQVYVYVFDQAGAVSNGLLVTLGGEPSGGDTTPPAAVTTLAVSATTHDSATLTWTAVGDDGHTGTAEKYHIRYSESLITAANWASATRAYDEPTPNPAGTHETCTVDSLAASTIYYFALKVADEVDNWSGMSNVASDTTQPIPDATPPAAVTTLAVSATTQTSATLIWTAVGDDGHNGTADRYDIRYSESLITAANWASATQVINEPNPHPAGTHETFTVDSLAASTIYYFALKVADEVDNWSGMSNVASDTTLALGDVTPPAPVDDLGAVTTGDKWVQLAWTAVGDDGHTGTAKTYDLRFSLSPIDANTWGAASRVSGVPAPAPAGQPESFNVDGLDPGTTYYFAMKVADEVPNWSALSNLASASTIPADNPSGIACGSWSDGNFIAADWNVMPVITGTSSIGLLVTQKTGGNPDAFRQIDISLGTTPADSAIAIHLYQPIVWDLDALGPIESLDAGLDFRSLNGAPACVGIVVREVATGESYAWVPTETAYDPDWTSYMAAGLTAEDFLPVRAGHLGHPGLGVGMGLILFGFLIGQCAAHAGGAGLIQAGVDNWWIDVNPEADPGGGHQSNSPQITQLSLRGNYPNPFKPETRIVFELPSTQPVQLCIFDPAGRLMRTLVNDTLPAGIHASVWQADDTHGRRVPSGVYLYRLQAGERVATRTACVIE